MFLIRVTFFHGFTLQKLNSHRNQNGLEPKRTVIPIKVDDLGR